MTKIIQSALTLILVALLQTTVVAETIHAVQDGDWHDPNVWDKNRIPESTDDVYIQGYMVYVSTTTGNVEVASLNVSNKTERSTTGLVVDGPIELTVNGDFKVTANNVSRDVEIQLFSEALLTVTGNTIFRRSQDNLQTSKLKLNMQESVRAVFEGDFTFDYGSAGSGEDAGEIFLNDFSQLSVGGAAFLYFREGWQFNFDVYNNSTVSFGATLDVHQLGGRKLFVNLDATSEMNVVGNADFMLTTANDYMNINLLGKCSFGEDVSLRSKQAGKNVNMVAEGANAQLDIAGDILMSAVSSGDVLLSLQNSARISLGGSFLRPLEYGGLHMDDRSLLILDGTNQQEIPMDVMPGGGNDRFVVTNISFKNTSGEPMLLTGPLTIKQELILTEGVIRPVGEGIVLIADGGRVSGGSQVAYIDGPITKVGSTNGEDFIFPTGDGGVYAPLKISPLANPDDEYTIEYRDDPPPIEDEMSSSAERLNDLGYWSVERTPGSMIPNVTLGWEDGAARGIDAMDDAVVAFVDTSTNSLTPKWISLGRSQMTGATGSGISGSITNALDDPPPIEDYGFLTIGFTGKISEETLTPLSGSVIAPVELISFMAKQYDQQVSIEWETTHELNSHSFVIERSNSGDQFEELGSMPARGENDTPSRYAMTDLEPFIGQNYYRLKVVSTDGTYYYTHTVSVFIDTFEQPRLYPNPVRDELRLFIGKHSSEAARVEINDQLGRVIFSQEMQLENGELMISTDQLNIREGGNYYIKVNMTNGLSKSFKFMKSY